MIEFFQSTTTIDSFTTDFVAFNYALFLGFVSVILIVLIIKNLIK
jgi:hypothetical protein